MNPTGTRTATPFAARFIPTVASLALISGLASITFVVWALLAFTDPLSIAVHSGPSA